MVIKRKKRVKPILVNIGLAFGFSFAGFLCSRLRINQGHECEDDLGPDIIDATCTTSSTLEEEEETQTNGSWSGNSPIDLLSNTIQNGDRVEFLLPEFDEIVKEVEFEVEALPRFKVGSSRAYAGLDKGDYEQEIQQLKNMVRLLQDKEQSLEVQLIEFCGLREQETDVIELENRLKISNMEVEMFNLKAENLQSENRRLREQVADYANMLAELDAAKEKIERLNEEIRREAEQAKEQIVSHQQRVAKSQKLEAFESEVEELRESNSRLQIENCDLTRRVDSTQILAYDASQESERLRKENDDLMKQIEKLQSDRRSGIEELVYMRWINACIRRELQNHQAPHTKTIAKDLSKSLSLSSEKKAKQSTMDFDLNQWSSSQSSSITGSGEYDHFSSANNSPASRTNAARQNKFFSKIRRLILGKDRHHCHSQVSSRYQEDSVSQQPSTSRRYSSFDGECSFSDFLGLEKPDFEIYTEALKDSSANDKHQRRGRSASFS
ncbi:unnamed protein product [Lathyrus oleraceus]|uniref:Protein CHUP1, chloroplastic n=3 Tax=Pisum sativum TaxID=3888 RepID=A0A9D4X5A3_PEA|nr:hypothetical protein KIW84_058122 [Pisum sativum]